MSDDAPVMSAVLPTRAPKRQPMKLSIGSGTTPPSLQPPQLFVSNSNPTEPSSSSSASSSTASSAQPSPLTRPQLSLGSLGGGGGGKPGKPSLKIASVTSGMSGLSLAMPTSGPSHYRTDLNGPDSDEEDPKWGEGDQARMAGELKVAIHGPVAAGLEAELSGATRRRPRSASRVGGERVVPGSSFAATPSGTGETLTVPGDGGAGGAVGTGSGVGGVGVGVGGQEEEAVGDSESDGEEELDIRPETLQDLGRLGEGASGEVRRVKHLPTGMIMAQKSISTSPNPKVHKQHLRELLFMRECENPYIVKYYGGFLHEQDSQIGICMEFCEGGSLDSLYRRIAKNGWRTGEKILSKIAESILSGLDYLHSRKIVHRDIKPSNVLVTSSGQVKLCDFGVSGELVNSIAGTFVGTGFYLAPERIRGEKYSINSDVWAMILTVLEVTVNRFPFPLPGEPPAKTVIDILQYWIRMDNPLRVLDPTPEGVKYTRSYKEFVAACLEVDPKRRPTPGQLLSAPWIQKSISRPDQADLARWVRDVNGPTPAESSSAQSPSA